MVIEGLLTESRRPFSSIGSSPPPLRQQFDDGARMSRKHMKAPDLTEADSQYIRKLAAIDVGVGNTIKEE